MSLKPTLKQTASPNVETENQAEKQVYEALNEINKTFERVLKTFGDVKWLDGEKKEIIWDQYRLKNLMHLELDKVEEENYRQLHNSIIDAQKFFAWSLRDSGWSKKDISASKKSHLRLKILKVSLGHILGIIKNTQQLSGKLYPFGREIGLDYQKSFDLAIWDMAKKVIESIKTVDKWDLDTEIKSISNLNPDLEVVQKIRADVRSTLSGDGITTKIISTSPAFVKGVGNTYSLSANIKHDNQITKVSFGAPIVTSIKFESQKDAPFLVGSNISSIKSVAVVVGDFYKKNITIYINDTLYDSTLKIKGEPPYIIKNGIKTYITPDYINNTFTEDSKKVLADYLLNRNMNEYKISRGGVEVQGLSLSDRDIETMSSFIASQTDNKSELAQIQREVKAKRANNNQKFKPKR